MLTRKCDICGREIGMVNAHYQLKFDAGFFRKEKDICISCFNRIKDEIEKPQQADTLQTERIKTHDYCDICNHNGCDNCISNNLDEYCVPSGYAPKDAPQTDCDTCKHYKLACELFSEVCKYEPTTQTETQNSNLAFDTPQTDRMTEEEIDTMLAKVLVGQTDCGWK